MDSQPSLYMDGSVQVATFNKLKTTMHSNNDDFMQTFCGYVSFSVEIYVTC